MRSLSPVIHLVTEGRHHVRYFGHSRSDSFDACGRTGEFGIVLGVCFVQLAVRQGLARAVRWVRVLPVFGVKAKGCCPIRGESGKYLHAQKIMKILRPAAESFSSAPDDTDFTDRTGKTVDHLHGFV